MTNIANLIVEHAEEVEKDQRLYAEYFKNVDRESLINTALEDIDWDALVATYEDDTIRNIMEYGSNFAPHVHVNRVILGAVKRRAAEGVKVPTGHGMSASGSQE